MKAVVVAKKGVVEVQEVPEPVVGEYDALCEVLACGICNGTDNHIVDGAAYHNVTFPTILGHEAVGRVIEVGSKVKNFKKGDIVSRIVNKLPEDSGYALHFGALAERCIVVDWESMRADGLPESEWKPHIIHRVLPEDIDPIAAVMLITWRETAAYLERLAFDQSEKIIILGSGANAFSLLEHSVHQGLTTAMIGSESRRSIANNIGASVYLSYKNENIIDTLTQHGFNEVSGIIDGIGEHAAVNKILPLLKHDGKIGLYGLDDFLTYSLDAIQVQGDFSFYSGEIYDEGSAHDYVMQLLADEKLDAWHYISKDHIYELGDIENALKASADRKVLKSVVSFV